MKQFIPRFQITRRLMLHKKRFNRYDKESKTAKDSKQKEYSHYQATKELAIIEELEYILLIYCNQYKEVTSK